MLSVSSLTLSVVIHIILTFFRLTSTSQGHRRDSLPRRLLLDFFGWTIDLILLSNLLEEIIKLQLLWLIATLNTLRVIRFAIKEVINNNMKLQFLLSKLLQLILVYLVDYYILSLTLASLISWFQEVNKSNIKRVTQALKFSFRIFSVYSISKFLIIHIFLKDKFRLPFLYRLPTLL